MIQIHRNGVIHRDIKLNNIMVSDDLKVSFVDFGYAKNTKHEDFMCSKVCGTPYYMPPEIIQGEIYNGKIILTDFFSNKNSVLQNLIV